jgi:hypothetical protein
MKTFIEKRKELQEKGISRISKHISEHDYGFLTSFRGYRDCGKGTKYTTKENLQRNKSLLAKLLAGGFRVTKIRGSYIEGFGSSSAQKPQKENTFFVVDMENKGTLKKMLLKLGEEFEQDSILFGKAGENNTILIGTNHCPNNQIKYHEEIPLGKLKGNEATFMSRTGSRPFSFGDDTFAEEDIIEDYGICKFPTEMRGPMIMAQKNWWDLEV